MGKLTANPRRFFGAFCSVVNMLSEEKGAAPQLLITQIRRLEERTDWTHARWREPLCTSAGLGGHGQRCGKVKIQSQAVAYVRARNADFYVSRHLQLIKWIFFIYTDVWNIWALLMIFNFINLSPNGSTCRVQIITSKNRFNKCKACIYLRSMALVKSFTRNI